MWKGRTPCYSILFLSFSHTDTLFLPPPRFLLGVPMGIRLPKRAGRFRNFAGGIPRAIRQLFKTISISVPKRDIRRLMLRFANGNVLKALFGNVQSKKQIDQSLTARFHRCCWSFSQRDVATIELYFQMKMRFSYYSSQLYESSEFNNFILCFYPSKISMPIKVQTDVYYALF